MNIEQEKYANNRVNAIERAKLEKIDKMDFTIPSIEFEPEKRLKLFKQGKFKIDENFEDYTKNKNPFATCAYFKHVIICEGERKKLFDYKNYEKAVQFVKSQANEIRDQIMLGDADKALVMIRKFESTK